MLAGDGWQIPGTVRDAMVKGSEKARAVIRVEQIAVSDEKSNESVEMMLDDSIYLGDKWEYRLRRGDLVAKAHGTRRLAPGKVWATIPAESVWVFAAQ
ncbi:MAG: hypothetical protein E5W99_14085 [Mesorhizobium sp.]|nr:MAG: hypothetical protein E5W99_14085 [Mesorhizobium sp.]